MNNLETAVESSIESGYREGGNLKGLAGARGNLIELPHAGHQVGTGWAPGGSWMPGWKRALDLVIIVALAPALLVVGAVVAAIVRLGSKGPVFFCQRRVGYRGTEFLLYKFRTMHVNAETNSHRHHTRHLIQSKDPMTKLDSRSDPRLVPGGALLRATGLDELPQLINVIKGDMSLVGPRPCIAYEYELYDSWQRRRLDVVPGLTGLWQVSGKNRTTFAEMVQFDIEYSRRQSLWLDLKIIFLTIPALYLQCRDVRQANRKESACASAGISKAQGSHL